MASIRERLYQRSNKRLKPVRLHWSLPCRSGAEALDFDIKNGYVGRNPPSDQIASLKSKIPLRTKKQGQALKFSL